MKRLEGKIAVITGASKGIGASIAKHFAAEGATVVINYAKSGQQAEDVGRVIEEQDGTAIEIQADVRNPMRFNACFKR